MGQAKDVRGGTENAIINGLWMEITTKMHTRQDK